MHSLTHLPPNVRIWALALYASGLEITLDKALGILREATGLLGVTGEVSMVALDITHARMAEIEEPFPSTRRSSEIIGGETLEHALQTRLSQYRQADHATMDHESTHAELAIEALLGSG